MIVSALGEFILEGMSSSSGTESNISGKKFKGKSCDSVDVNTGQGLVSPGHRNMSQLWLGLCAKALG